MIVLKLFVLTSLVVSAVVFTARADFDPASLSLAAVNSTRTSNPHCGKNGQPTQLLRWSSELATIAQVHAEYLSRKNKLTHINANGETLGQRVTKAGYRWQYVGENLAKANLPVSDVIQLWLKSAPHRQNLCSSRYEEMGMAASNDVWVAVFAAPKN